MRTREISLKSRVVILSANVYGTSTNCQFPTVLVFVAILSSDRRPHTDQRREKKYICTVEGYLYPLMVLSRASLLN